MSKHLKKPIRSTITSVAWHPNSVLLAAGSTDAHARVFSSYIKSVDARPDPSVWGERLPFNTVCGEFLNNSAGWVHSVAFSPSGDCLAFAAHDSSITVVYPSGPEQPPRAVITIPTPLLPFRSLIWAGESEIIAAGYNCEAFRFKGDETGWQLSSALESNAGHGHGQQREESALNMFKQMDLKGKVRDDTQLKTIHQNTINTLRPYEFSGSRVSKISSECLALPPPSYRVELRTDTCGSKRCGWKNCHLGRVTQFQVAAGGNALAWSSSIQDDGNRAARHVCVCLYACSCDPSKGEGKKGELYLRRLPSASGLQSSKHYDCTYTRAAKTT